MGIGKLGSVKGMEIRTWLVPQGGGSTGAGEIEPFQGLGLPRNLDVMILNAFDRLDGSSALVSFHWGNSIINGNSDQ